MDWHGDMILLAAGLYLVLTVVCAWLFWRVEFKTQRLVRVWVEWFFSGIMGLFWPWWLVAFLVCRLPNVCRKG